MMICSSFTIAKWFRLIDKLFQTFKLHCLSAITRPAFLLQSFIKIVHCAIYNLDDCEYFHMQYNYINTVIT